MFYFCFGHYLSVTENLQLSLNLALMGCDGHSRTYKLLATKIIGEKMLKISNQYQNLDLELGTKITLI